MGGQAHLLATHVSQTKPRNCPSISAGGQRGEGWKGRDERGVKKDAHLAVTKQMANTQVKRNERMRMKERVRVVW